MASKPENYITFKREQLAEILGRIARSTKPKDKDVTLRKAVFFGVNEDSVDIYATNEIISLLFNGVDCEITGEVESFAVDLIRISRFASTSKSKNLVIVFDDKADKMVVKANATIKIGYWDEDDFTEITGKDDPTKYPEDLDSYTAIKDVRDFRNLARIMIGCTDIKKPHLSGIYTDGEGKFMSTDAFKGMYIELEKHQWGFEGLIPNDFFGLLDSIDGDVYLYFNKGLLWARDEDANVVVSSFTRSADKFPSEGLTKYFEEIASTGEYKALINAEDLSESIKQLRTFFGADDLVCKIKFKKKMVLEATGTNNDKMKTLVKYVAGKDSDELVGFEFAMQLGVLGIIPTLFDGEFTLQMIANNKPMFSQSKDLGIKLLLTPYTLTG